MRRMWHLVTLVSLLWATEPRLSAQNQQQHIFISLTAPNGTRVTDLQANEVNVTEDGVACEIVQLEPVNWPTKLHVLVDNGKINTDQITSLRDGLGGLFQVIPDGVEMSLYTTAGTRAPS